MSYADKKDGSILNRIYCRVIDSKIWNINDLLIELTYHLSKKQPVTIDLAGEAPCCESLGLNKIINKVLLMTGTTRELITIETGNLIQSSFCAEVRVEKFTIMRDWTVNFSKNLDIDKDNFCQHFGMFVSRCNWKRLAIANYLWKKFKNQSIMTFHFDPKIDYHKDNFGLERFLQFDWANVDVMEFLRQVPIKFDDVSYPIPYQKPYDLNSKYQSFFCDIVCETYFTGQTFSVTEKTQRSIINKKPFIVQGPQFFLKNLKNLGFKTFNHWWSEGYDEDIEDGNLMSLFEVIDYIGAQKLSTLRRWYKEMQPMLDHNYQLLLSINADKILSTEFHRPQ